jgi:hypothetical protein
VAVNPDGGAVFITGTSFEDSSEGNPFHDYATVVYNDATGAQLWASRYDKSPGNNSEASSLAVSPDGTKVFVTGSNDATGSLDYATVAYQP